MPSLRRNEKSTCENCGFQTTRLNNARHKKILFGPLHVLLAAAFRQSPELISIITLPRNTLRQLLGLFFNAKYVTNTLKALT